jgi:Zn-dependent peptidase ImmA (M78 family)
VETSRPIPSMLTKPDVHAFAESVATQLGYNPGDPMEPLLAKIGGRMAFRDIFSSSENADSIKVDPDGTFTIFVSGLTSAERDRFTIAHELGHYFLHFPIFRKQHPGMPMVATRWVDETNGAQRRAEWEANWFAAAFLMPEKLFRDQYEAVERDIRALASKFGVSVHAAEIRLKRV